MISASLTLRNSILWDNTAPTGTVTQKQIRVNSSGSVIVTYSVVQDDDPNDVSVYAGTANLDDNPRLDANSILKIGSPAIDSGENDAVVGDADLDAHPDGSTTWAWPTQVWGRRRLWTWGRMSSRGPPLPGACCSGDACARSARNSLPRRPA